MIAFFETFFYMSVVHFILYFKSCYEIFVFSRGKPRGFLVGFVSYNLHWKSPNVWIQGDNKGNEFL